MRKILLMGISLFLLSLPSQAQWIGVHIGIPDHPPKDQRGAVIPANSMTFNGKNMTFNSNYMSFSGQP